MLLESIFPDGWDARDMPIYEYSCKKCGEVIERIQKFSDAPLKKHEACGGTLTKLISQSAFQLKGSGWYVTDYAKSGAEKSSGQEDGSSNREDGSKSDKTDSKPDKAKSDKAEGSGKKKEKSGPNK